MSPLTTPSMTTTLEKATWEVSEGVGAVDRSRCSDFLQMIYSVLDGDGRKR